jgi:predicted Ser/Thr protein kinase
MIETKSLIKGRYRVGRRLGEGGMAIVYAGHDLSLGRDVAIKTLRPQFAADTSFRARFAREGRAAASLSHPNIIDVFDVGEVNDTPYLVMELIRGQPLKAIIAAEAPFHPDDVAELLEQVGGALDYAHTRGYVHRDIKPGNILVDEHGRARIVDFGIAKGLADSDLTEAGSGFGTVGYLSPEQAEGLMATPASDIYALGVVAFEMLTGKLPFWADTPVGVAMQHVHDPAPRPSNVVAGIPTQVDEVVLRALDKDPTRRWPSAGAFAQALRSWRRAGVAPPAAPVDAGEEVASRSSLAPTLIVIVLVIGALAALLWMGFRNLPAGSGETATTVPSLTEPTITGAVEVTETPLPDDEAVIDLAPTEAPPTIQLEPPPAPTIAPVEQQTVVVPNLYGLTIPGSTQAVLSEGLSIALAQTEFSDTVPMNAVIAQDPPAGATVAPGTVVRVTLSRGPSPFRDADTP